MQTEEIRKTNLVGNPTRPENVRKNRHSEERSGADRPTPTQKRTEPVESTRPSTITEESRKPIRNRCRCGEVGERAQGSKPESEVAAAAKDKETNAGSGLRRESMMGDARCGRVRAEVTSTGMVGKVQARIRRTSGETQEEPTKRQARTGKAGRPGSGRLGTEGIDNAKSGAGSAETR
jgi:hypothetical protein